MTAADAGEALPRGVEVSRRRVEAAGGSLRVTVPAPVARARGVAVGDELRVAVVDGEWVAFCPRGVPFPDGTVRYCGNATVHEHNGCRKVVLRAPAPARVGVAAGDVVAFAVTAAGVVRCGLP